jgi:GTP cyclohydrolase I
MNKDVKVIDLQRKYDKYFTPSQTYLDSMPDLQNGEFDGVPIDFVGIHNFHLPIKIKQKDGGVQEVKASITGQVSLDSVARGINMSRIIRTFYKSKDDVFDINKLEEVLRNYQKDLKQFDAHIIMEFDYWMWQPALRSVNDAGEPEGGYQFYHIVFDTNLDVSGEFKKIMWVDFVYSSACPCSTELSYHAALERGVYGIPHSQRSIARIGLDFDGMIWIEDVIKMCQEALTTETLVFCKRQDEQAFAEKNGAQTKFVEDAVRILYNRLNTSEKVKDFKVICCHRESLHSHDAIAVITKGIKPSIFKHHVTLGEFKDMAMHC